MTLAHKSWIEDITVSLLLKCPAKSLIRFKCVCKSWSTLIHNPEAIGKSILFNAKNKNTNSTTSQLLISRINKNPNPDDTEEPAVFSLCSYNNLHEMSTNQYLPSINSPDHGDDFFLWNPATERKDYKVIKLIRIPTEEYYIELYNLEEDYWKRIDIQGTGRITTFDIGKEVFMNTRLPVEEWRTVGGLMYGFYMKLV
ncbi:putative F-box protein At5g62060 [Carica papaya]|uniref:putative F-box protein At5g62060 n=1 Tax=Carica papaya TaxID=3649 RepID=UPI000B8CB171|nr:putative F-box protein At5g62060 [Carica papaya]